MTVRSDYPVELVFPLEPHSIHTAGVVFNHIAEVIVPFAHFAPSRSLFVSNVID